MPGNGCLKTARRKASTEDAFPLYTLPSSSGTLGPEKGIQTITAWHCPPLQEFAQLLFWSSLEFHPLLQPLLKFCSFITCPASLVCTDCQGFLRFLSLPFASICDFRTSLRSLQLTLARTKQGSAIHSTPTEIFKQQQQQHLHPYGSFLAL